MSRKTRTTEECQKCYLIHLQTCSQHENGKPHKWTWRGYGKLKPTRHIYNAGHNKPRNAYCGRVLPEDHDRRA